MDGWIIPSQLQVASLSWLLSGWRASWLARGKKTRIQIPDQVHNRFGQLLGGSVVFPGTLKNWIGYWDFQTNKQKFKGREMLFWSILTHLWIPWFAAWRLGASLKRSKKTRASDTASAYITVLPRCASIRNQHVGTEAPSSGRNHHGVLSLAMLWDQERVCQDVLWAA